MLKYALLLAMALLTSACGLESDTAKVGPGWNPEQVQIQCPSGDCPDAAGALIFVKNTGYGYSISRCTATLIGADTILTNAHCDDKIPDYTAAYFILPGPVVGRVTQKIYEALGEISGLERDLAIFKLNRTMPAIPRKISRHIPERMDKLVAYVINQDYWDSDFTSLVLDKRTCRIDKTMPLFGGGADDKTLGLALFDCEIKPGNSGSAVYTPEDTSSIQALVNTLWQLGSVKNRTVEKIRGLFFEQPEFLQKNYGMAERLHCSTVPFQVAPTQLCQRVNFDVTVGQKFREALSFRVDQWFAALPASDPIEWTLEVAEGEVREWSALFETKPAVQLVPHPFCLRGEAAPVTVRMPLLRLGLLSVGAAEARMLSEDEITAQFLPLPGGALAMQLTKKRATSHMQPTFTAAQTIKDRYQKITASSQRLQLPTCGPAARLEARLKAMDAVNAVKVTDGGVLH